MTFIIQHRYRTFYGNVTPWRQCPNGQLSLSFASKDEAEKWCKRAQSKVLSGNSDEYRVSETPEKG